MPQKRKALSARRQATSSGAVPKTAKVKTGSTPDKMMVRPLPGLKNMGNTCWLNAVMQALTHCQCLVEAIEVSGHSEICSLSNCVLCSIERHVQAACRSSAPFMSPETIVKLLPFISSSLMRGRQEDAHEFLRTLVNSMQRALDKKDENDAEAHTDDESSQMSGFSNSRKRRGHAKKINSGERRSTRLKLTKQEGEEDALTDSENDESVNNNTSAVESQYPYSLFKGAIQNQVRCTKCKKLSTKEDPVEDLELEIDRSSSLESALAQFCAEEELKGDNAYHCERCRAKVTAKKRIRLHRVPPVLTLSLKRFAVPQPYATAVSSLPPNTSSTTDSAQPLSQGAGLWSIFGASNGAVTQKAGPQSKFGSSGDNRVLSVNSSVTSRRSRNRGGPQKIQHYVHYPEYLDLTGHCSVPERDNDPKRRSHEHYLRLFAVVVHLGSTIGSGHYVAYVRSLAPSGGSKERASASWHRMDDCNVTLCSTEEALNQCAYILFYERCPDMEVKLWQHAQADGRLSDINRLYSEKLLASQSKEDRIKARSEDEEEQEDEKVVHDNDQKIAEKRVRKRASGAGVGSGRGETKKVARALLTEMTEVEVGDRQKIKDEQEDGQSKDKSRDEANAAGLGSGGLLSWLFASSPPSSPNADSSVFSALTVSAAGTEGSRSSIDISPVGTRNRSRGYKESAPVKHAGRNGGKQSAAPLAKDSPSIAQDTTVSAPYTRARKRQRVGPGEGIVKAVAEFVGGIFYEK